MSKHTKGYIRQTNEGIFSLEVENVAYDIKKHGIKNLASFCENVNLDVKEVYKVVNEARIDGYNCCDYGDWTIYFMDIAEWRKMLIKDSGNLLDLNTHMMRIHGKIPVKVKDFPSVNQKFASALMRFMER